MPKKIDPVCGMEVDEKEAVEKGLVLSKGKGKYYFCSTNCMDKFQGNVPWYKSDKFGKIFPYFLGTILVGGTILSLIFDFMLLYMGIFFIIFSSFKVLDWKGFANAFEKYDLIAAKSKIYALSYPAIEFVLGVLFIINYFSELLLIPLAIVTLFIMGIGGIGISIKLIKKEKFQCACLGTKINVPLTSVTILEDLLMVVMAVIILLF